MTEKLTPEEIARRALFSTDDTAESAPATAEPSVDLSHIGADEDTSEKDLAEAEAKAAEEAARRALFATDEDEEPSAPEPQVILREPPVEESAEPTEEAEEVEEEEAPLIVAPPDDGIRRRWYAVHVHSGQEAAVQRALSIRAEQESLADMITNILVPMEQVQEFKSGQKKVSKRKYFPGYLLVQLPEHPERNPDLWHLIKDTPSVTGFIGSRSEPVPLEDFEVTSIVEEIRGERERPRPKLLYEMGERVKIIDGAFANFMGNIGEINEDRGRMKVMIEIFERQTSVEVEFWQVEKL